MTDLRQTYDRPVIELSKYIMQQTCDRLFLQQTYNKLTTDFGIDLRQTYGRPVIEFSKYIMTDLRQL